MEGVTLQTGNAVFRIDRATLGRLGKSFPSLSRRFAPPFFLLSFLCRSTVFFSLGKSHLSALHFYRQSFVVILSRFCFRFEAAVIQAIGGLVFNEK